MKRIPVLLLFSMVALSANGFAQENKKKPIPKEPQAEMVDLVVEAPAPREQVAPVQDGGVFIHVEEPPSFPGGSGAMFTFIQKNKKYPQGGPDADKEGKVYVAFIVKSDGSIEDVTVKRSLTPSHDAEAIRVVKMMPKWIPGKQNGKAVNCWYTIPVDFYFL